MELFFFIAFIIAVVILSALISGSEAALLSISYAKAKELVSQDEELKIHKGPSHNLLHIKENIERYITTIVVLNNIVNIIGSIYVGVLATSLFGDVYLGFVSAGLTFAIILFSEIIPKIYGEKHSQAISLTIVKPLLILTTLLTPIVVLLEKLTRVFIKQNSNSQISEGEIKEMANLGREEGSINSYESEVIGNVFKMNDVEVYDLMVPKNKVRTIEKGSSFDEIVELITQTGFTRFPVQNSQGDIIGLINTKDLFKFHGKEKSFKLSSIIRPIIFAPETMKASTLEEKLKKSRIHLAAIVNEHGDFTGIVSLEDILEEIVGEIEDEFDLVQDDEIKQIKENKYHIEAAIDIEDLNKELDLNLETTESYSTLNGFLVAKLDGIPKINDTFEIEEGIFRVIRRTKRKILSVEFVQNS